MKINLLQLLLLLAFWFYYKLNRPWLGNCVGRRNYKSYFFLLFWSVMYLAYIMACSLAGLLVPIEKPWSWKAFLKSWKSHYFLEFVITIYLVF
ncbi:hypothetical protein EIN_362760 [Entamoeba invadens IP1]|uniref:Palmitoyltransferase n=1 Tax=Entamoeba invadens IP1 TaxID=370355 RepID=A0A0A1U7S0_ENTIV|nr:hypothetical protein EIN_362760 [Entamoeba invadens IP1]ELP90943.1 hypothetical protein EIN_362760 [Entamoeba invadens IP1]|eukprot:XP_004257714.1 hypothetical protein EIN_362760 [Entamoeba invadens IP1]